MLVNLDDSPDATLATRRILRLDQSCGAFEALFEVLRAIVWGIASPPSKAYVTRVLGAASPVWRLLSQQPLASDEAVRVQLREGLTILQDAGDVLEAHGGFWMPATTRLVRLPDNSGHLIVGGAPTALLPVEPATVTYHGPHRHLADAPMALRTILQVEDLSSWARLPEVPLQRWAEDLLNSTARQPYAPINTDTFEFYQPRSARRGEPQFRRWSQSFVDAPGVLLARRTRLYGTREYRLIETHAGRIVRIGEIDFSDVRRLMYALDAAAGNPTRVRVRNVNSEWVELLFSSELPRSEQRILAALGSLRVPDERPFHREWSIVRSRELAMTLVGDLGVELEAMNGN